MFADDMSLQHERMCRILLQAVTMADQDPVAVEIMLQKMGAQHARHFDVIPEHYPFVGRALVRAVRALSMSWSTEIGSAWVQVYEWLAAHMVLGARTGGDLVSAARPTALRNAAVPPPTPPRSASRGGPRSGVPHQAYPLEDYAAEDTAPAERKGFTARLRSGRTSRLLPRRHRQASPGRTEASSGGRHGA
jgi:hypothetical protein